MGVGENERHLPQGTIILRTKKKILNIYQRYSLTEEHIQICFRENLDFQKSMFFKDPYWN